MPGSTVDGSGRIGSVVVERVVELVVAVVVAVVVRTPVSVMMARVAT